MSDEKTGFGFRLWGDPAFRARTDFFGKVILFRELRGRALTFLARSMQAKAYAAGEVVFQEGDLGRAFFVIERGKVELFRRTAEGGEDVITVLGPYDFFGEMALLDELPRSATARTLEPSTLHILYKSKFMSILTDAPDVASKILFTLARLLSARLRRENFRDDASSTAQANPLEVM